MTITEEKIKYATGEYDVELVRRLALPNAGIDRISGLERCKNLLSLALPHNRIREIQGLSLLAVLQRLDLARNKISRLSGLEDLGALEFLDLQGNDVADVRELERLRENCKLVRVHFKSYEGRHKNPCCDLPEYTDILLGALPKLQVLDGERLLLRSERQTLDALFDEIKPDPEFETQLAVRSWFERETDQSSSPPPPPTKETSAHKNNNHDRGALCAGRDRAVREARETLEAFHSECADLAAKIDAHVAQCRRQECNST
ncbi:hypothetical protein CTAYLR_003883 [Chrysophaeum taylorii]|uniref:Uncharacterized protein n=1 Tax=Chrysophaeum taylorii TaxID=2483200 RepID=A0AAD7UL29_9STRA|nr:hypothetical protein CTAYLR_003883 [Chrysophaeum taylorii]